MSHAILIKSSSPSLTSLTSSLFSSNTTPSFSFTVSYSPAELVSSSSSTTSQGAYQWSNAESSHVENTHGSLGEMKPTNVFLTKRLHQYPGYNHSHELIIEHNASPISHSYGQRKVFFVFFLQYNPDLLVENELDQFLNGKSTTISLQSLLQNSWKNNGANAYYQTHASKEHVFLFPTIIPVKTPKLQEVTGTPKPAGQIYRNIFVQTHMNWMESNQSTTNPKYHKERTIIPTSYDVQIQTQSSPTTQQEGFSDGKEDLRNELDEMFNDDNNDDTLECEVADLGDDQQIVAIESDKLPIVNELNLTLPFIILIFVLLLVLCPFSAIAVYKVMSLKLFDENGSWRDQIIKNGAFFVMFSMFLIGLILSILANGKTDMLVAGIVLLIAWAIMQMSMYICIFTKPTFGNMKFKNAILYFVKNEEGKTDLRWDYPSLKNALTIFSLLFSPLYAVANNEEVEKIEQKKLQNEREFYASANTASKDNKKYKP
jgi:hypothetical protein